MCKEELTTGIHNPPDDFPWLLAEVYYHKPEQLKEEFINQELNHINTYAVEGMAWLDKDYFANMLNNKKKEILLELIKLTENDSYLLSFSPHIMIAVQKNEIMGIKDVYYKALIDNNGLLNEIDLGEKYVLNEEETRELLFLKNGNNLK